ncbi:MAG: hypothetical protein ACLFQK_08595, partial [Fibrobacterota bacterium]
EISEMTESAPAHTGKYSALLLKRSGDTLGAVFLEKIKSEESAEIEENLKSFTAIVSLVLSQHKFVRETPKLLDDISGLMKDL